MLKNYVLVVVLLFANNFNITDFSVGLETGNSSINSFS